MQNPFETIPENRRPELAERWVKAGLLPNKSSGWDLFTYDTEWGIYSIGEIKEIGRMAGIGIEIVGIDLQELLDSDVIRETMEDAWTDSIESLDEVYLDLVFDFIASRGLIAENQIKITQPDSR